MRWLVFDAEALSHADATGIHALTRLNESLRSQHITLVLARLKGPTHQVLQEAGFLEEIGEDQLYPTVRAAVLAGESFQKGGEGLRPGQEAASPGEPTSPNEAAPEGSTSGDEQS